MDIPRHDWISRYLKFTSNTEPPILYKEWIACSVIASVLQRKVRLNWGTLTFFPNLYVVLVGPSGRCRKGVAMSTGHKMLRELAIKTTAEAITREALIKNLAESAVTDEGPGGKQIIHSSLTVFSKELAVFLGQDNKKLMMDLTDWYDCDDKWEYRTKGAGVDEIIGVWLNLIGATTPELVQTQLPKDAVGGGLSSRIIFVFEDKKAKKVAAPFLTKEQKGMYTELKNELEFMNSISGEVGFDDTFVESYAKWYEASIKLPPEYGGNVSSGTLDKFKEGPLAYYNERRANHVMRLCIILSASQKEETLTEQILFRAINLLERTEVKMPRTFGGYGGAEKASVMHKIMELVAKYGRISRKDILKILHFELDDLNELDKMLQMLSTMKFCRIVHDEKDTIVEYNTKQEMGGEFIAD
jgi:hypothetical protein